MQTTATQMSCPLAARQRLACRIARPTSVRPRGRREAPFVAAQNPQGGGKYYPDVYQSPSEAQRQPTAVAEPQPGVLDNDEKLRVGTALRNIGWLSFWSQLTLNCVSAVILLFSTGVSTAGSLSLTFIDVATMAGVVAGFISTFLAWSYIRAGRRLGMLQDVRLPGISGTVLASTNLNLLGLGATIVGLQATVGSLVSKTLLSASANPYAVGRGVAPPPPVALDVFSVQACTNTIMAHFVAIIFSNWLLSVLNKAIKRQEQRDAELMAASIPSAPPMPGYSY